jgi:MscS family membrane protein
VAPNNQGATEYGSDDAMQWLRELLGADVLFHAVVAVAIVAAFYLLSRGVKSLLNWIGRKIIATTETVLDDRILAVALAYVKPVMVVIGLHVALREISKGTRVEDVTLRQILEYSESILYIVVILLVVRILLAVVREIIDWYLERISAEGAPKLKLTLGPLTHKVVNLLVGLIAMIIVLDHFGINIGSLLVSLGVGSLAVALAAQDTLANMIAGFVILVDSPFRVGDRIELTGGQVGDVQQIGLRSTRILNFDNNVMILPNAELVKGRIVNYSYPYPQTRVLLRFELAHGTDPEKVRRLLLSLATSHQEILRDPPPRVYFTAITDYAIQLTLVARCESVTGQYDVETTLREQAYLAFLQEGIEVGVPQRIVRTKAIA